jgi:hypothetical protein
MTNKDLYDLILYAGNKENFGGYLNATQFQTQLVSANIVLLKELLGITNDYNFGAPVSRRQKGLSTILDDATNLFKKKGQITFTSGIGSLPADYFKYDSVRTTNSVGEVEMLFSGEVGERLSNYIDVPTTTFPVCEIIGKSAHIYPTSIPTADIIYYRYPISPVFDYYVSAVGEIIYLANGETHELTAGEIDSAGNTSGIFTSASVELEWGDSEKIDIAWIVIKNMGINLSRQDLTGIAAQTINQGK